MSLLAIIHGAAMTFVAYNNNRAVSESLKLRFENQALVEQLSAAQTSLAEANRT
jgi:hypothetical protein